MTLAETCDRIEAALEWYVSEQVRWLFREHLRTLVELGELQLQTLRDMGEAYALAEERDWDRLLALKARVLETIK